VVDRIFTVRGSKREDTCIDVSLHIPRICVILWPPLTSISPAKASEMLSTAWKGRASLFIDFQRHVGMPAVNRV
jgi:hypothetical protein